MFSHRPTDAVALVAQCRAVAEKFLGSRLHGWSSDFSKAYKQVPADPSQCLELILVQYDPAKEKAAFFIPLSQVFGSKTAPINFARYLGAFMDIIATVFLLPATHCVDDVIFIEDKEVAVSGKFSWDALMKMCGWLMSSSKDSYPDSCFPVIGVSLNLAPFPQSDPTVMITARRISSLAQIITKVMEANSLGSGEAASVTGKLGFALSVTFGKLGRCRIRPIIKRAYSARRRLDTELRSCLLWWLSFLDGFIPCPIPKALKELPLVISYSDGEGGLAGIGAAMWHPAKRFPLAVYSDVPEAIREHWRKVSGGENFEDIFLVEALGPLLQLLTFPKVLSECLWLHFIDNSAAEASLVRGSSASPLGDHVVGLSWACIQRRSIWSYFDRVASKSNPSDGLSRRKFDGPWQQVYSVPFPTDKVMKYAESFGQAH